MFQPAGVRTLLDLRSSCPRAQTATLPSSQRDVDCRPCTAPATFDCDESECLDAEQVVAAASHFVRHLKEAWTEERNAEIQSLWSKLEEEYGMTVPRESLFPTESLDVICEPLEPELPAGSADPSDEALLSAAEELATVRRRRAEAESRLHKQEPMPAQIPDDATDGLSALREDLARLRSKRECERQERQERPCELVDVPDVSRLLQQLWDPVPKTHSQCMSAKSPARCACSPPSSPARRKHNIGAQLDDILQDFNEIDRLFDEDVCQLSAH